MPQITGLQTGTPENDVFNGEVFILDLSGDISDAGILDAEINTLGGDDRIAGKADVVPIVIQDLVTTAGVVRSSIDAGVGNDTVSAIASSESATSAGGTTLAYGMLTGLVSGQDGDDRLVFSGSSINAADGTGIGAFDVTVSGGEGRDFIKLDGSVTATSQRGESSTGVSAGVDSSTVQGGADDDNIRITATTRVSGGLGSGPGSANGVAGSFVTGDDGDDRIIVSALAQGTDADGKGLSASGVTGGAGDDTLRFVGEGNGFARFVGLGIGTGIERSLVNGDAGDDVLTFVGMASGDGAVGSGSAEAYGVRFSEVNGGSGAENIRAIAKAKATSGAEAYGVAGATINGGDDDDFFRFVATAESVGSNSNNEAIAYGVFQSNINGDGGDDRIVISAKAIASQSDIQKGYGAADSTISGGAGNDVIRIFAAETFGEWDIDDVLLNGDGGNDVFNVGIGSGDIFGGDGNDIALLQYFDSSTMTIAAIDGGIRVSGTQNKLGAEAAWSQDIVGVERFRIDGRSLNVDQIVSEFG